jgi:hypothetical protein
MRNRLSIVVLIIATTALGVAVLGQEPLSYARDVEGLFIKECGDCHSADNPKKGLDLSLGRGWASLVDVKSQELPDVVLVKAGDPAGSYLWHKVAQTAEKGRGMPRTLFGARKLLPEQLDLIERWIKEGAKP